MSLCCHYYCCCCARVYLVFRSSATSSFNGCRSAVIKSLIYRALRTPPSSLSSSWAVDAFNGPPRPYDFCPSLPHHRSVLLLSTLSVFIQFCQVHSSSSAFVVRRDTFSVLRCPFVFLAYEQKCCLFVLFRRVSYNRPNRPTCIIHQISKLF